MALCYKSQTIYAFATSSTTTKTAYSVLIPDASVLPENCAGAVVLGKTEYNDFLSNITNFGWDESAFNLAVESGFMFLAIGLGVGLLISVVRKFRV